MTFHILAGFSLLALAPLLAYLCIPPAQRLESTLAKVNEKEDVLTTAAAALLIVVNSSTILLVPHPTRSLEYRNRCPRRFYIKAITNIHTCNLTFLAMTLMAVAVSLGAGGLRKAVWIPGLGAVLLSFLATCLYIGIIIASCLAIYDVPFEVYPWVKSILFPCMPKGIKSRSNLIASSGDLEEDQYVVNISLIITVATDIYAAAQGFCIFMQSAFPGVLGLSRPEQKLERFYVIVLLYSSLVMNAGFFVIAQGDKAKWVIKTDAYLTQVLPVAVTFIGHAWMEGDVRTSFLWQWTFWSS